MRVDDNVIKLSQKEIRRLEEFQTKLDEVRNMLDPDLLRGTESSVSVGQSAFEGRDFTDCYGELYYAVIPAFNLCGEIITYLDACPIEDLRLIFNRRAHLKLIK